MTAKAFEFEEQIRSGLKVEVDLSLAVERPPSSVDVSLASTQFAVPPVQVTPVPGLMPPPRLGAPTSSTMPPMVRVPSHGSGQFPDYPTASRSSGPADLFSNAAASESTAVSERNRKRRILIIVGAAGAALSFGAVLLVMFGLSGEMKKQEDVGGTAGVVKPVDPPLTPDAAGMAVNPVVDDAGAGEPPEQTPDAAQAAAEPPPRDCVVDVSSTPNGAEIVEDNQVVGTTPAKLALPCGVAAKLVLRKGKLGSVSRTVNPTEAGVKVRVAFAKPMLSVKVTSSPPGATITMGGKSLGVTPAMVRLPAKEAATLSIAKPGFGAETQKITPKQNNQAVHVTLKKAR